MAHGNKFDKESVNAPGGKWSGLIGIFGFAGIGLLAAGAFVMGDKAHGLHSYLTSFMFYLSIALGGLFFVMLQHLTRAGWSVVVRRLAEGYMKNLILMALLFIPILMNVEKIYAWADPGTETVKTADTHAAPKADGAATTTIPKVDVEHKGGEDHGNYGRINKTDDPKFAKHLAHVLPLKHKFLNKNFFTIRACIYFLVWIGLALFMFKNSVSQDSDGEAKRTIKMGKVSAGAMLFFALTLTFAAFDWMMSLDYGWFSTIFGVIYFASGFIGLLASLIISSFILQKRGYFKGAISIEHYHDMGKFMFAFIIFWAYVSFSQYILIRYPNIPEETIWYLFRWEQDGGVLAWKNWSIALPIIHFFLPFLLLMSRHVKRNKVTCTLMACWMLVASYIHFYWLIMPTLAFPAKNLPNFGLQDIMIVIGMGLIFIAGFLLNLKGVNLLPIKDPRLKESLKFTNF
jgi:hypothetical protein